jgi:hypothetical protein
MEPCLDAGPLTVFVAQRDGADFAAAALVATALIPPSLAVAEEGAFSFGRDAVPATEVGLGSVREPVPATEVGRDLKAALGGDGFPVLAFVAATSVELCSQDIV